MLSLHKHSHFSQIENYNEVHDAIDQCENRECINGWLALDIKPLKYGLLNLACKWSHMCKKWLLRYVQGTLKVRPAPEKVRIHFKWGEHSICRS